jgi:hypothetical protein
MTPYTTVAIDVIATFEHAPQMFFTVEVTGHPTEISEASVLYAIFMEITENLLPQLCKLSLCLMDVTSETEARQIAPWLFCKDSPLHNGKFWLKQHKAPD